FHSDNSLNHRLIHKSIRIVYKRIDLLEFVSSRRYKEFIGVRIFGEGGKSAGEVVKLLVDVLSSECVLEGEEGSIRRSLSLDELRFRRRR
ncbi:hypothetical protein U1Q18_004216, partial [Sarracenia purpurea var. burkii]